MRINAVGWLVCLLAAVAALGDEPDHKSPNVLIIMCDQLNARILSCYGGPVSTPHIDRLAREGVRFTQAVCPTPFCSPTRASIITGLYPHTHGIVVNCRQGTASGPPGITADDVTTEKLLHASGYATHHYGKWHLFGDRLPYYPDTYNVDEEYYQEMKGTFAEVRQLPRPNWMEWYVWSLPVKTAPAISQAAESLGESWSRQRHADFVLKMGRLELPLRQNFDVRVADLTVERIRALSQTHQPFMITCSFNGPHDPNVVPSPYYESTDPSKIELPHDGTAREKRFDNDWSRQIVVGVGEGGLREFLRIYYGTVRLLDDQIGRVLDALDAAGVTDDTIIVLTADHGDMAGGHGMVWKSTSAFYDEIVCVPLLIRYPRKLPPRLSDQVVDLTDLMPTLLELLGRPIPPEVQGQSILPALKPGHDPAQVRRYAFSERVSPTPRNTRRLGSGTTGAFMIRGQDWKYIRYGRGPNQHFLYNLADDPGETRNLANDPNFIAKTEELSEEIDAWLHRTRWPG